METQRGSVLVYILIAVALFAALGYAVSNMMRGGGNIGQEKSGLLASEIMSYGRTLREAAQGMKISNACEDVQISFEHSPFDGSDHDYFNAQAPKGFSCHIFHADGGGVGFQDNFDGQVWSFTGEYDVKGVGTEATDLVAMLPVRKEICVMINERLGISNEAINSSKAVNDGANDGKIPPFQGGYADNTYMLDLAGYEGKMTGCYLSSGAKDGLFTVYQVLVAR